MRVVCVCVCVCVFLKSFLGLMAQGVKNLPVVQEAWIPSLDWEDSLEKKMAILSSIIAWRFP